MHPRPTGRPRGGLLRRHFERSRLAGQFLASAYELVVPVLTRPLPQPGSATPPATPADPARRHSGG
jgi:hypothetical protein